jgi:hypothetical protein
MIDRRVALIRTLRGFLDSSGVPRDAAGMRYANGNDRLVGANFVWRGRDVFVQFVAPSQDQDEQFEGEVLPLGRISAYIDGNGPVIKGPINQRTWDDIIAACAQAPQSSTLTAVPICECEPEASTADMPVSSAAADLDNRRIVALIEQWAEKEPEPAGELADLVHKKMFGAWKSAPPLGDGTPTPTPPRSMPAMPQMVETLDEAQGRSLASRFRRPPLDLVGDGWAF